MLLGDDLAWFGRELIAEFAAPGAVFESPPRPRRLLSRRNVLPGLIVARTIAMVHGIKDAKLRLARGVDDLQHVRNAVVRFGYSFDAGPEFAAFGNEVVVRIHHQQRGGALVVC